MDILQNSPGAMVSVSYCLCPKLGATISMPLHYEKVKKGLQIKDFNIHKAMGRIKSESDIFKPVPGKAINIEKIIRSLSK